MSVTVVRSSGLLYSTSKYVSYDRRIPQSGHPHGFLLFMRAHWKHAAQKEEMVINTMHGERLTLTRSPVFVTQNNLNWVWVYWEQWSMSGLTKRCLRDTVRP
jgi:hypothetical protein